TDRKQHRIDGSQQHTSMLRLWRRYWLLPLLPTVRHGSVPELAAWHLAAAASILEPPARHPCHSAGRRAVHIVGAAERQWHHRSDYLGGHDSAVIAGTNTHAAL